MTTSPTEQEIVARAMCAASATWPSLSLDRTLTYKHRHDLAQAAIHALDHHRAKNAGEVERECAEIIDRNKMYMDGFDGKNELVVGPLNLRWRVEEASDQLSKAANLISSMRAVIEEKDRTLDRIAKDLPQRGPQGFEDFSTAYSRIKHIARSTISDGVK